MSFIFKLPDVGEGINEGEIVQWFVKVGDTIEEDAPMLEVQNDKLIQEIPSPIRGVVEKILVEAGRIAVVGEALIELRIEGSKAAVQSVEEVPSLNGPSASQINLNQKVHEDNQIAGRLLAMPSVRQYAREKGIDLSKVIATGKHGHITKGNVDAYTVGQVTQEASPVVLEASESPALAVTKEKTIASVVPVGSNVANEETREKFTVTRKAISKAMVNSSTKIPHVTIFDEVDVSSLVAHRQRFKEVAAEQDIKLTYLPYIVKAVIAMVRKFPVLNASVDEVADEIIYKQYYNIGIAMDTPQGLYVPNVKQADRKGVFAIAKEVSDMTTAAHEGKLASADMRSGTITITNIGSAGGLWFTPIINHPEVAIVGVGRMDKKPVILEDGTLGVGTMLALSLSFDHRIVDGKTAQLAMNELKRLLSDPELLLMEG